MPILILIFTPFWMQIVFTILKNKYVCNFLVMTISCLLLLFGNFHCHAQWSLEHVSVFALPMLFEFCGSSGQVDGNIQTAQRMGSSGQVDGNIQTAQRMERIKFAETLNNSS